MKFILQYPEVTGTENDLLDAGPIAEIAVEAEQAGFDAFALTEHPAPGANWLAHGGHQTLDPFVGLSFAAAATQTLRLLTYLTVVPYRNPLLLAKASATLDRLSGGRLTLGVGTGYHKTEFFALGVDFEERNDLFTEAVEVLPQAWGATPFSYKGRHFDARNVLQLPAPIQQPIPIWIGGNSRIARRRVSGFAQGWMPLAGSPQLAQTTHTRHVDSLTTLASLIGEVKDSAGDRAAQLDFVAVYDDETLFQGSASDQASRHQEAFAAYAEAGVTQLIVNPTLTNRTQHSAFIAEFGATYIAGAVSR